MTGAEVTAILTGVALFGAAVKAGPSVWAFIRNMARLPSMIESIWLEFGRGNGNGVSTTRDRIEHIARKVDRAEAKADRSIELWERNDEALSAHLKSDAAALQLIAQSSDRVAERLGRLEAAVAQGTKLEGEHAHAAASAAERRAS